MCFVKMEEAQNVMKALEKEYKQRTGIECSAFITAPSQGARVMTAYEQDEETSNASHTCSCCNGCNCPVKRAVKSPYFWISAAALAATGIFLAMRRKH